MGHYTMLWQHKHVVLLSQLIILVLQWLNQIARWQLVRLSINIGMLVSADRDMQLGRIFEDKCAEMYYRVIAAHPACC